MSRCLVTCDQQPLWLKATGIIEHSNLAIVARLGGFHTVMSFLGAIGKIMKGSGLQVLLAEVYAEHSVEHILSGKAASRALRVHFYFVSSQDLYNLVKNVFQVVIWKVLDNSFELPPDQWGWEWKDGTLVPVITDLEFARGSLLQVVRCNYKQTSKAQCRTNQCSCRKHGLPCTVARGDWPRSNLLQ